ncbi:MAG: preprotein translocase subunit SecE [Acutalibacteraceae bacterium]
MAKHEKSEAAEKIEKAAKAKKAGAPKVKKGNIFKRMGKAIAGFFKDFKGEMKKITWPGAKMVLKSTLVVIVAIAIIGVVVFAIDLGLSKGVNGIKGLGEKYQTSQSAETDTATADEDEQSDAESTTDAAADAESTSAPTSASAE